MYLKKLFYQSLFSDFLFKRMKAYRLYLSEKKNNNIDIVCCYDLKVSPPTIGDFLYLIIFLRYLAYSNKRIDFFLINDQYRKSWNYLDKKEITEKENYLLSLLKSLIPHKSINLIKKTDFREIKKIGEKIIFKKEVFKRKPLHNHYFNLNNIIFKNLKKEFIKQIIFKEYDFENVEIENKDYISWHVRYSDKWDLKRNINEKDFKIIGGYLTKNSNKNRVMIISDKLGCDHCKKMNLKFNFNLLFSSDYTNSFEGSANLVLKSKFYFQYKGGGMFAVAVNSQIPYLISIGVKNYANEYVLNNFKITSFANKDQIFIDTSNISRLENILKKIKDIFF